PAVDVAVRSLRDHLTNAFAPVFQPDGTAAPAARFAAQVRQLKATYADVRAALNAGTNGLEGKLCEAMRGRVRRQFDMFHAETRLQIVSALHQLVEGYTAQARQAFEQGLALPALQDELKRRLIAVSDAAGGARAQIRSARGTVGEVFARLG